jgi:exo-1,4-beta-D-glucosaminidase
MTPQKQYTDYTGLQNIKSTTLKTSYSTERSADSITTVVTVTNTGNTVAFQVHLRALKGEGGDDILPVIFSDNYILLAPGEKRAIKCSYAITDADTETPFFIISGWNLAAAKCEGPNHLSFENALVAH